MRLLVDVPEHIEASQSDARLARDVATLTKVASAHFSPPSVAPDVDFKRQTLLEEVEREGIEEPMGWDDAERAFVKKSRPGAVSEGALYRCQYI